MDRNMSESQLIGQKQIKWGLIAIIAISVISILANIYANNFSVSSIIRLLLTVVLCYYCYKGNKAAAILLVILCSVSAIAAAFLIIGLAVLSSQYGGMEIGATAKSIAMVQSILMCIVYSANVYLILGAKKVKDYLKYCRNQ